MSSSLGLKAGRIVLDQSDGKQVAIGVTGTVLIKAGMGRVVKVSITTSGVALALHDAATTGAVVAGNQIVNLPTTAVAGVYDINLPFINGLVAVAAAGVYAISYN